MQKNFPKFKRENLTWKGNYILYSGELSWEKTFMRENFHELVENEIVQRKVLFADGAKRRHAKSFTNSHKTSKFAKVFSLKSFHGNVSLQHIPCIMHMICTVLWMAAVNREAAPCQRLLQPHALLWEEEMRGAALDSSPEPPSLFPRPPGRGRRGRGGEWWGWSHGQFLGRWQRQGAGGALRMKQRQLEEESCGEGDILVRHTILNSISHLVLIS